MQGCDWVRIHGRHETIYQKKKIQLACNSQKHHTNAVFILNVNYIQLNYGSIYHTPFNFYSIMVLFTSVKIQIDLAG